MTPEGGAPRLDSAPAPPETGPRGEGAAPVSEPESPGDAKAAAERLLDRVDAAARRLAAVRAERTQAQSIAHQAQVREALTRTELTLALNEALIGRADALARARNAAFEAWIADSRGSVRTRRRTGVSRAFDRALARMATPGKALVIARSGVWRGEGLTIYDLRHMAAYARRGANPDVSPPALFDQAWYLEAYPDVAAAGAAPLVHYLLGGGDDGRAPHALFDVEFYRRRNAADLSATGLTPLEHFVRIGAAQGRTPHPLFDVAHYLGQSPRLQPQEDPLSHYLREGWALGLSPHPLFDPAWYRQRAGRAAPQGPPLAHYVTKGWRQGIAPHPLFDPEWYLAQNPDVAEGGDEPLTHFVLNGASEGRSPSPWFDLPHYVAARGEDLSPEANPLIDYLQGGAWRVAEARPGFPTAAYLAGSPDLVREGVTPLEHWARRHAD